MPTRLLKLVDREFAELTGKPVQQPTDRKFKPLRLNPARFDASWDRKRGAAIRLTAVLLGEDDTRLEERVCEDAKSAKTYSDAAE